MEAGRRQLFQFSVTGASGSQFTWWPASDDYVSPGTGNQFPGSASGLIRSVQMRLHSGGGWTFNALRLRIADPVRTITGVPGILDPATVFAQAPERIIYDSGALAVFSGMVLEDPLDWLMPFGRPFTIGLEWGTSAGAGTSTFSCMVGMSELP